MKNLNQQEIEIVEDESIMQGQDIIAIEESKKMITPLKGIFNKHADRSKIDLEDNAWQNYVNK